MDSSGPFNLGDFPDDSDTPDDGDFSSRGWVDPDDRLWRHPSEMAQSESEFASVDAVSTGSAGSAYRTSARDVWRERRVAIAAGTLGAAAVAAAAVVVLTLSDAPSVSTAQEALRATETSLVTLPSVSVSAPSGIMQLVSTLRPSLVELESTGSTKRAPATGVVLPGGVLVMTAASAASGLSHMVVVTSDGRHLKGELVATDKNSGVAVVSTSGGLSPATFADSEVVPGDLAVTACLGSGTGNSSVPSTEVALSMVQGVGEASSSSGGNGLMDAIAAETPLGSDIGGVMLDGRGDVIGMLGGKADDGTGGVGLFVPASLAVGVADELASIHRIEHGWIGVSASDAPGDTGALVMSVFPSGPAATSGLQAGDVVTEIDAHPVDSHADLQARLYTLLPGSTVELTVVRSGETRTVSMALAADPGS